MSEYANPDESAQPLLPPLDSGLVDFPQRDNAADVLNQVAIRQCRERQLLSALAENESLKAQQEVCDVCGGDGVPISGKPCICGGSGNSFDEKIGLRRDLLESESENESLKAEAERFLTQAHNAEGNAVYQQRRAEKAEAERDQALELIREYRATHLHCGIRIAGLVNETKVDVRCPTCIKADELLKEKA